MERFAFILRSLGDPIRLRILRLLLDARKPLCICELVDSLEERQYNVSKHIGALKRTGIVETRREGRWVYCQIASSGDPFISMLANAVESIPRAEIERDRAELRKRLKLRVHGRCLLGIQKSELLPPAARNQSRDGR